MTVLRSGSASDVGRVRTVNQDLPLERPNLYAVADGMGGHVGGEVAARVAVETLDQAFERTATVDGLREAFSEANAAVWHESQFNTDLRGMGTTLTAVASRMVMSCPMLSPTSAIWRRRPVTTPDRGTVSARSVKAGHWGAATVADGPSVPTGTQACPQQSSRWLLWQLATRSTAKFSSLRDMGHRQRRRR